MSLCRPAMLGLTLLATTSLVRAQDAPEAGEPLHPSEVITAVSDELWEPGRWTLQLEPTVWFAALGGDVQAGNGPRTEFKDIDGDADSAHAAFSLRGLYRKDRWTVMADGFFLDLDEGGAASSIDMKMWSADASVGYQLLEWKRPGRGILSADNPGVAARVIPYAGFRVIAPDITITTGGGADSGSDEFLHPFVGLRIELEIFDRFSLDTGADVGGFDLFGEDAFALDWTLNIRAHLTENITGLIGFRQMFLNVESDDVLLDGSVGGLMAGVTIRF